VFAALYCLVLADAEPHRHAGWLETVACFLAVAACFVRTTGLVVLLGIALFFILRRRYRGLIILVLLFAAAAVPWQLYAARTGHANPYLEQLLAKHPYLLEQGRAGISAWALRFWQNLRDYVAIVIPRLLCPTGRDSWVEYGCGIILSLLAAVGLVRGFRRLGPLSACAVFAAPVLISWPNVWVTERFLLPFLPLVAVFLFYGVQWLGTRFGRRRFVPVFVGVLVLANVVRMTGLARTAVKDNLGYLRGDRFSGYSPDWRRYFEAVDWVRQNTPPDAVVMARKPEFVFLLSGRRSFSYPLSEDRARMKAAMLRSQFVLVDAFRWTETTGYFLVPFLQENPGLWDGTFGTSPPETYVLKVIPDG
jgi:hypothetical protein